jgi:hypothetical protein
MSQSLGWAQWPPRSQDESRLPGSRAVVNLHRQGMSGDDSKRGTRWLVFGAVLAVTGLITGMALSFSEIANSKQAPSPQDLSRAILSRLWWALPGVLFMVVGTVMLGVSWAARSKRRK